VNEIIIFKRPHNKIGTNVEEVALAAIVEAGWSWSTYDNHW